MDLQNIIAQRSHEDGDCIIWTGACVNKGTHPVISVSGKSILVRRAVWEAAHGLIPTGKIIRCTCDTPRCIAPDHLKATTFQRLGKELGAIGVMSGPVRSAKIAAAKRAGKQAKLTQEQVREIRAADEPGTVLAVRYGVAEATISKYRLNRCRREFGGNPWQGLGA